MNIADQIKAFSLKKSDAAARQLAIMEIAGTDGRTLDDEEKIEYDSLSTEMKHVGEHLDRLNELEKTAATTAVPPTTRVPATGAPRIIVRSQDADDKFKGQGFTRMVIAKAIGYMDQRPPGDVAQERWGKTHPHLVQLIKAGVAGGGTGSGEWGAELVTADGRYTGDFIDFLNGVTVFNQLPLREIPENVTIKGSDGASTAFWVGQSKAIPVTTGDFFNVTLASLDVATIAVISKKLARESSPAAESLVRDKLVEAVSQRIDTTFLGAAAASAGVSPAGLLNGLSSLGSNGYTADALRLDVSELLTTFITAKNASGLYWVVNPNTALAISMLHTTLGVQEFPGLSIAGGTFFGYPVVIGDNVGATSLILMKPSDIYKIGDRGIQVSVSQDATIEQDSAPQGASDTPTAASATLVSMFQTESLAIKVVRPINYAKRRASAVAFIGDAQYGNASSTTA